MRMRRIIRLYGQRAHAQGKGYSITALEQFVRKQLLEGYSNRADVRDFLEGLSGNVVGFTAEGFEVTRADLLWALNLKPKALHLDDTRLETWFERDRSHVNLVDKETDETIVEWWDEGFEDAVSDGFLDTRSERHLHQSAYDYAIEVELISDPFR